MSEANIPPTDPTSPEVTSSSTSDWFTGWDDFSADAVVEPSPDPVSPTSQADWQTVNFPNAISADAIDRQSLYAQESPPANWTMQAVPNPSVNPPVRVEDISDLTEQPDVDDLISLIQELNQCNNALLDRVSQLEDALETSQKTALGLPTGDRNVSATSTAASESVLTPEQIAKLLNEFEFLRQANKRQEILVETLKGELESSQERVAHLERDCALVQQRYNEQAQVLIQSENGNRDLRTRLQRQQRYTLQFKAALEKCLEVPPPSYTALANSEDGRVNIPLWYEPQTDLGQNLLPKVQRIQPWSSQSQSKFLEKLNLSSLVDELSNLQSLPDAVGYEPPFDPAFTDVDVTPVTLSASDSTHTVPPAPVSYDIKRKDAAPSTVDSADLSPALDLDTLDELSELADLSPDMLKAGISELQAVLGDFWSEPATATEAASLPASELGEAALWQDLARLIEVSADDLVKASMANDFSSFESVPAKSTAEPTPVEQAVANADVPAPVSAVIGASSTAIPPLLSRSPESSTSAAAKSTATREQTTPFGNNPNWPSPLVHPLRPTRKLSSLSAVDLPKFS